MYRGYDKQYKVTKQANETEVETAKRRASNRQCQATKRANEPEKETSKRRAKNCYLMAKARSEIKIKVLKALLKITWLKCKWVQIMSAHVVIE